MAGAFQATAFQNTAFQVDGETEVNFDFDNAETIFLEGSDFVRGSGVFQDGADLSDFTLERADFVRATNFSRAESIDDFLTQNGVDFTRSTKVFRNT